MSGNVGVMAAAALAVLILMVVAWIISLPLGNTNIADAVWGAGFVAVAWVSAATGDGESTRSDLVAAMVTVWGIRLTIHLWWRGRGKPESRRHRVMRRRMGDGFSILSLPRIFLTRALIIWIVSLPMQLMMDQDAPTIGALAVVGVAIWGIGFFFESVGDSQLARFRSNPENDGRLLDTGLWRYTRHPNYFGDFCVWWGIFLVAAETTDARLAIVGPALMTVLLTVLTGVRPLERSLTKRVADYADYKNRTSVFFPRPPRTSP